MWFCHADVLGGDKITLGNCLGLGTAFRFKKAGSNGSKEISRLMTDLKVPESARKQILFIERDGDILWLPGVGHGAGFTNSVSREKYIASRQGSEVSDTLISFAIERQ